MDSERVMMSLPSLISFTNAMRVLASQRRVDPFITTTSEPFSPLGVTHAISLRQLWSFPS
jgi:hypothetical protein